MLGWSLGIDPDAYSVWHSSEYPNGFNFIGYSNPVVDQGLIAGRLETRTEQRKAIYEKVFLQIAKDVPYIFLYYPKAIVGVQPQVKGLSKPGPLGILNTIEDVRLTQ
jgi:peptide/nickel transport system substrate-binding protein